MKPRFSASIAGRHVRCRIGADRALRAPVFCFSLMAPARVVSGGRLLRAEGGYAEVALPDIAAGGAHELTLAYAERGMRPVNRAWLPLGAYLRLADGRCLALPPLPAGARPVPLRAVPPADGLRLVPPPADWRPEGGEVAIEALAGTHEALAAVDALARRCRLGPFLAPGGLPVEIATETSLPAEGYRLRIGRGGIRLAASGRAGLFYGAITLLQLMATHARRLPLGTITDAPRFAWRGQHLDCARHFFRPDTILRLLDLMALFKLNRFHWHFADDEAFRLRVACLPELWQRLETRGEGQLLPGLFGGGIASGGSYGRADAARILRRARDLNIEVMPEIEVPAHALGMVRALPGLRDPADTGRERSVQGYPANTVNPAMARTWEVLEALIDELAEWFPFEVLHLGCDEPPEGMWSGSPAVAALMRREGLAGTEAVQGWMMRRLAARLVASGRRPAAWEEAARGGGIGHGALLFSWTGQGPGIAAARAGHEVVMCPARHAYFDMAHSADPDDWGAAWAGFVSLGDTVDWSPVPPGAEDIAPRIAGVQGAFWSEFTTEDAQMEPMLAPRILGLACKAWEREGTTSRAALHRLAAACAPLFSAMGWASRMQPAREAGRG